MNDYLNKAVVFSSPYGEISVPIRDFLDEYDIELIKKDNDAIEDIENEIIDSIYFNLDFISKIV